MRLPACLVSITLAASAAAAERSAAPTTAPGLYAALSERVAAAYDSARGGFVDKSGTPSDAAIELALRRADDPTSRWRARGLATLAWTRGLLDSAGGGYHHDSRSADPTSPNFEKRTDSNAQRLTNLLLAWRVTGDKVFRREAERVAEYLTRVPFDARGGFAEGQFGHGDLVPSVNGVAAHAWFEWAAETKSPQRRDEALATLDRLWAERWIEGHGFLRVGSTQPPAPLLIDQVEMGRAYVIGASVCGRAKDRGRAIAIGDLILERFTDPKKDGFRTRSVMKRNGAIGGAPAVAAENARAARFLCELAGLTGDQRYRQAAGKAWLRFAHAHDRPSLDAAEWALAVRAAEDPEITRAPQWAKAAPPAARKQSIRIGKIRK